MKATRHSPAAPPPRPPSQAEVMVALLERILAVQTETTRLVMELAARLTGEEPPPSLH